MYSPNYNQFNCIILLLGKSKEYHRKKSNADYEFKKIMSKLYRDPNQSKPGESFTRFFQRKKKDLGNKNNQFQVFNTIPRSLTKLNVRERHINKIPYLPTIVLNARDELSQVFCMVVIY